MRRLMLSLSVVFAFGAMCTGGGAEEEEVDEDPVVVPVDGDEDEEAWCCEYQDEGATQYALVDGPSECNTKYGAKEGRYISGNQCIPCCCETPKDADDLEKGYAFELTTPKSCNAAGGECKAADAEECSGEPEEKERAKPTPRQPRPRSVQPPERRGSGGGRRSSD